MIQRLLNFEKKGEGSPTKLSSNLYLTMSERFDCVQPQLGDVCMKLHQEILCFRDSAKDIFHELHGMKKQLISKIQGMVKKCVPQGHIDVYGSHSTQLCLPWSDVDLIVSGNVQATDAAFGSSSILALIDSEIKQPGKYPWIAELTFIAAATVPVIKIKCHLDLKGHENSRYA